MNRFFVTPEDVLPDQVVFTGANLHHLSRVLRLRPGDRVLALTGDGQELEVELEQVGPDQAVGTIVGRGLNLAEPPLALTLVQGLPKGDKMDLIIQKGTELGMARFLPVSTERAVVRLEPGKAAQRQARWQTIAREAAEQSRRGRVPLVSPVTTLAEAIEEAGRAVAERPDRVLALFLWEEASELGLADALDPWRGAAGPKGGRSGMGTNRPDEVWVFIGPEGGFSPSEADMARRAGILPVSLGPRILRTETAGPAVAAVVLFALGDLGRAPRLLQTQVVPRPLQEQG